MKIKDVALLSPKQRLEYWVRERHQVYLRKLAGKPKPWTDDEVLQRYWFTNPYREHDKVTQWFRNTIRGPWRDDPKVLFSTIAFRWFTRPQTGQALLDNGLLEEWDTERAIEVLRDQAKQGPIFTGAYVTSNGASSKPKLEFVCEDVLQYAWERCGPDGDVRDEMIRGAYERKSTMREVHEILTTFPGMGGHGFMAYEIVCDLRYTKYLEHAPDKCTWSNPGPGAKRGLNMILGRPYNTHVSDTEYQRESRSLLLYLQRMNPKMPPFEMREVEHILCETFKYNNGLAILQGKDTGVKMKRVYNGGA